ncbi:hypothetical protein [Promicromonospora sp. NPDC050262]|uniref:hypothetical protein n=1 Tax=Promicromonospora sp. NPDC050262 TaxID=3155036 RepID=UPI0033C74CFF
MSQDAHGDKRSGDSGPQDKVISKEEADRLKQNPVDTTEGAIPGEEPKDDPDREGEDRFDAG